MSCVKWCDFAGTIRADKLDGSLLGTWEIILATFTNWFTNELLGVLRKETPAIPTQLYVAINSTVCDRANQGTELSGDGYARTAISFERVSDIQNWNPADIFSPTATADWTVRSFSIHDAPTGGNYYAFGNLTADYTLAASKAILWGKNKVVVGLGSPIG